MRIGLNCIRAATLIVTVKSVAVNGAPNPARQRGYRGFAQLDVANSTTPV